MASNLRNETFIRLENGVSQVLVEIDCDAPEDLPTPETRWLMGSIAHVISTGDFYELNSSGQWVNQTSQEDPRNAAIS